VRLNGVQVMTIDGSSYIWSIIEDITEQKRFEESSRLARALYETSNDAIIIIDSSTTIVDINPTFTKIIGYSACDAVGKRISFLQLKDRDGGILDFQRIIDIKGMFQGQVSLNRADGVQVILWARVRQINAIGRASKFVVKLADVTQPGFVAW